MTTEQPRSFDEWWKENDHPCLDDGRPSYCPAFSVNPREIWNASRAQMMEDMRRMAGVLQDIMPVAVIQGDAAQHLNPHAKQMVNSNCAWLVTDAERTAHKLRNNMDRAKEILALYQQRYGDK